MSDQLEVVATAANQAEAEMIEGRLAEGGIHSLSQRSRGGPEMGGSGARSVFVRTVDLQRARAVLESAQGEFSDEELARLSEEAGREAH